MARSVVKNVLARGILEVFNTLLPFIITPYVYRVLGRQCIGDVEYMMLWYSYFGMLGLLGIYNYGLRSISSHRDDRQYVQTTYKNLFCIGIISNSLFLLAYLLFVTFFIKDSVLRTIGYIYSANLISQIFYVEWVNEAFEEFRFITIKTIIIKLINTGLIFGLVRSESDAITYVTILSIISICNYSVSFVYAQKNIGLTLKGLFSGLKLRGYIKPLLIILVLKNTGILYTMMDRTILGHFKGTDQVALFSIGQKIGEISKTLVLSIVFATLPRLALYLHENKDLYQDRLLKLTGLVLMNIIPAGIGLFLLAPQIIWLFGGTQFAAATLSMRVFAIRIITLAVESIIYNQVLFLNGKEKIIFKYNLICGALNVVLNFIFLRILTPFTSILFTWISELIFQALCLIYIRKNLKIHIGLLKKNNLVYIVSALAFVPVVLFARHIAESPIVELIISIPICIIIYFSILYMVKEQMFLYAVKKIMTGKSSYFLSNRPNNT